MSRTYRKRKDSASPRFMNGDSWRLNDLIRVEELEKMNPDDYVIDGGAFYKYGTANRFIWIRYTPTSKIGKRIISKYRTDCGTHNFKEPGPSWFKKLYTIRPERRRAKRELHKFMKNEDYEVQFHEKYFYEYWT